MFEQLTSCFGKESLYGGKDQGVVTFASLEGKHIGVTLGTRSHFVLNLMRLRQKLSTIDFLMYDLPSEALAAALVRGEVNAVATREPYLSTLHAQLGADGAVFYSETMYELPFNLAGKQDDVDRQAETIEKLLRALAGAERFCQQEPRAERQIMADATRMSLASLRTLESSSHFKVTLSPDLLLTLEEGRHALGYQASTHDHLRHYHYLHAVFLDALKAVKPEAMTGIH